MRLTIDIGNTNTKILLFDKEVLKKIFILATEEKINLRTLNKLCILSSKVEIKSCGISSVVKGKEKEWIPYIKEIFRIRPLIINYKTKLPIRLKVKNRNTLGTDRICSAVAGYEIFNRKEAVVVVDTGTAVTFNVVLKNGSFVGGAIMPGLDLMSKALFTHISKLPLVEIRKPASKVIGDSSHKAIKSGVYHSYLSSIYGITGLIQAELGYQVKKILTGSSSSYLKRVIFTDWVYQPNLVSAGINAILKYNKL